MTQKIITITREYGSGGRLIAKKVAEALNIAFYDNELIDENLIKNIDYNNTTGIIIKAIIKEL